MKITKYNIAIPYRFKASNGYFIYNTLTSALALLEKTKYESLIGGKFDELKDIDSFIECGFIVNDTATEKKIIAYNTLRARFNSEILNLVICPTNRCNFLCSYCYQKDVLGMIDLSSESELSILDFVRNKIKKIRNLNITWYGGEPLLRQDIIERLSKEFIHLSELYDVEYKAAIITNGYLLSRETFKLLDMSKVNSIQITLDGIKNIHDQKRRLKNGKGSFDTIVENLLVNQDLISKKIAVRINVNQENINQADKLFDFFKRIGLSQKLHINWGKMLLPYAPELCLSQEEFANKSYQFQRQYYYTDVFPEITYSACSANHDSTFLIDSDGSVYKCWDHIGKHQYSVFNINNIENMNAENICTNCLSGLERFQECGDCAYLPFCISECPMTFYEGDCSNHKYTLLKRLENYVATLEKES